MYFDYSVPVARLTRFEGRGHKKVPKGPPFAYVFLNKFQRVPPLLMFSEKSSKGSPLCLCFLKKIQKQIIKGGSIGFFSSPPRFDGGPWPPGPFPKCATVQFSLSIANVRLNFPIIADALTANPAATASLEASTPGSVMTVTSSPTSSSPNRPAVFRQNVRRLARHMDFTSKCQIPQDAVGFALSSAWYCLNP